MCIPTPTYACTNSISQFVLLEHYVQKYGVLLLQKDSKTERFEPIRLLLSLPTGGMMHRGRSSSRRALAFRLGHSRQLSRSGPEAQHRLLS